jgi:hypothetical protein
MFIVDASHVETARKVDMEIGCGPPPRPQAFASKSILSAANPADIVKTAATNLPDV